MESEPLTFEKWLQPQLGNGAHYAGSSASGYAEQGWNARQPEIDALRERNRKLREYASCNYDCISDRCSTCDRPVEWTDGHGCEYDHTRDHPFTPKPCSCGLATLVATKEVE